MANSNQHRKFGKRHILAIWLFTGYLIMQILRSFINIAIVSMVNDTMVHSVNTDLNGTCPIPESNGYDNTTIEAGEFYWDYETQGLILGSYYYGYIATQFIAGYIVRLTGPKILIGVGTAVTSLLTIINPIAARISPNLLIIVRASEGLLQGTFTPSVFHMLGFWAPTSERTSMFIIPFSGIHIGTIISAPLTGWLCEYGFAGGWPSSFYVFGGVGLLWCVGWFLSVHDTPADHPSISKKEKTFIEQECPNSTRHKKESFRDVPWKSIFTSIPVWAGSVAHFSLNWCYYTLLAETATYLHDVLHIGTVETGLVSSLPYVCFFLTAVSTALLSDKVRALGVKTVIVRKVAFCGGSTISAVFLIVISFVGCDVASVIVILCIAVGINGCSQAGYGPNNADLAPQYSGILLGITNTAATVPGIVSPIITGVIINKESTTETWRTVFIISCVICLFGAVIFGIFGQAEVQPWAKNEASDSPSLENESAIYETKVKYNVRKETVKF